MNTKVDSIIIVFACLLLSCKGTPTGKIHQPIQAKGNYIEKHLLGDKKREFNIQINLIELEEHPHSGLQQEFILAHCEIKNLGSQDFNMNAMFSGGFYLITPDNIEFRQLDNSSIDKFRVEQKILYNFFTRNAETIFSWENNIQPLTKKSISVPFFVPLELKDRPLSITYYPYSRENKPIFNISIR